MLTRDDVERITENVLRNLSIDVRAEGSDDSRVVVLQLGDMELSRAYFDITQKDQYKE